MIIAGRNPLRIGQVTGVFDKTGGKPGPVARALVLRASTREAYIEQTKARGTYDLEMANPRSVINWPGLYFYEVSVD